MARRRLSKQQQERIARIHERRRAKVEERAEAALEQGAEEPAQRGLVIARHGQNLVVQDEDKAFFHCLSRQNIGEVVCGDQVVWQPTEGEQGVVTAILPRRSTLSRPDYSGRDKPLAANITQLVVVLAPEPEPAGFLTDQYLIAAELIGVKTLITLNKSDLFDQEGLQAFEAAFAHYRAIGYPLISVSAKREHGLDPLIAQLRDETSILVGQSGVGKSSLINALIPDQAAQVGRLSGATGLGRHTTSTTTLYHLPSGGQLIDSPGVRSFRLGEIDRRQLEQGFREFQPFLGHCRFSNCAHDAEPGCALRQALADGQIHPDRLNNFLAMASKLR